MRPSQSRSSHGFWARPRFGFADVLRCHGHGFPGGVAHAFAAMRAAFPRLDGGRPVERREVAIRTAFRGPGGHDALEMVTRGRSEGRTTIASELAEPARGILQNYVWEFAYRGTIVTVHVADAGIVVEEFITLGQKPEPRPRRHRRLGRGLQHRAVPLGDRLLAAGRLRRRSEPATGTGAAPPGKLRADVRCYRRAHAQFS